MTPMDKDILATARVAGTYLHFCYLIFSFDRTATKNDGRICVGMNLANNALFINMVSVLWAVKIKCPIGSDGKEIIPDRSRFIDDGLVVFVNFYLLVLPILI